MLWGRGIVRSRARLAGFLKATSMPEEQIHDGWIHSFMHLLRIPSCLHDAEAQAPKRQMITNGAMVSPRPGFKESHFDKVIYLVDSLCEFGSVTIYILSPSLDNNSTHLRIKCI